MKILICYFSGTGNTKRIASLYKNTFEMYDNEVIMHELSCKSNIPDFQVSEYDFIGIGYPVHAFNAPRIILDFCKALPKGNKKVFIFKTSGEPVRMNDISSLKAVKMLKRKGYLVTNEYHYIMPYNIIFRHSDAMAYKMWTTAKKLIPMDIKEILNGVSRHPKRVFCGNLLAWFMRIEHWGAHINGKFYKVKKKECSNCKLCINTCPVKNIKTNKKGKIVFGRKCMMCMRCAFNCPKNAINIGLFKSWKVNGKYSFEMPTQIETGNKHDKYCKKAYNRYFDEADSKIQEQENLNRIQELVLDNMEKHTCELKDTIEYNVYSNSFKMTLILALICFFIIIGAIISLFCSVPLEYALQFTIACCVVYLPFFWILIYLPAKWRKKKKYLIANYDSYEEMEVLLSIPITVRGIAVKYVIKVKLENGIKKEIESHIYNSSRITSNKMLIGYNSLTNDVIFLKNI